MLEDTDKIAISMSGGLDSSLMAWLLCKEISSKNKNIDSRFWIQKLLLKKRYRTI